MKIARWFWDRLRLAFPAALAAALMPDHFHLIAPHHPRAQDRLSAMLARLSQVHGLRAGTWEPVPEPELIPNRAHLRRQLRYVALNPCRDRLCRDPLEWLWSTHRDIAGAVFDPWVTSNAVAAVLGENSTGFFRRHHLYVSSDPSVSVTGTKIPQAAPPREFLEVGLPAIWTATAAAFRGDGGRLQKREFVRLAIHQGWSDHAAIGRFLGVTGAAIRGLAARGAADDISAAALCLGDRRLTLALEATRPR
jgi:hypothetical protein